MKQGGVGPSRSIRVRLYWALGLVFCVVLGLGIVGFARLSDVNHASEVIRNHWLRDTRILGDLSNYMSDFRTAEATCLLSTTPQELAESERELADLRAVVAASQRSYEEVLPGNPDAALYREFAGEWRDYQAQVARVISLVDSGAAVRATRLYNTDSRRTFDRSSDSLVRLTQATVVKARHDSELAAATYAHARDMILASMLLAAALLVAVVIYITRGILEPLLKLVGCMLELARNHSDVRIPCMQRSDEIGDMARAVSVFRENALALAGSQRRLIEQAAALEEGLEHERRLTAQQRDFVSMTSHEFRTPLTIIDGHAQRLIKTSERLDAADIAERGERIRGAVHRITDLMDSLLGTSRVLDGNAVFHPQQLNPLDLLRDVCQVHRDATRGVVVAEEFQTLPPSVFGDPKLLFHAFSNLLSNAIKYSPPGSTIEVSAARQEEWLVVQVRDNGMGIPARDRQHLFERYFRGSNATGIAGTGVGLHLVSMVVALHGGEVLVESLEGVGSRFIVRMPVSAELDQSEPGMGLSPRHAA